MLAAFDEKEDALLIASGIEPVYPDNKAIRLSESLKPVGKKEIEKVDLYKYGFGALRPGCTYGFKRQIVTDMIKCWFPECWHDLLIWNIALMQNGVYVLNRPLMIQKRYSTNNTPSNQKTRANRSAIVEMELQLDKLLRIIESCEKNEKYLANHIRFEEERLKVINDPSIISFIKLYIRYDKYYRHVKTWVGDYVSSRILK